MSSGRLVVCSGAPARVEVAGYAAEGLAIAWNTLLIWRERKPVALG